MAKHPGWASEAVLCTCSCQRGQGGEFGGAGRQGAPLGQRHHNPVGKMALLSLAHQSAGVRATQTKMGSLGGRVPMTMLCYLGLATLAYATPLVSMQLGALSLPTLQTDIPYNSNALWWWGAQDLCSQESRSPQQVWAALHHLTHLFPRSHSGPGTHPGPMQFYAGFPTSSLFGLSIYIVSLQIISVFSLKMCLKHVGLLHILASWWEQYFLAVQSDILYALHLFHQHFVVLTYRPCIYFGRFIPKYFSLNCCKWYKLFLNSDFPLSTEYEHIRNMINFCVLALYPITLLKSLINSKSFFVDISAFFADNHVICEQQKFYFIFF